MTYKVLNITAKFRAQWEPRQGLEGPFFYDEHLVLYYDPKEGKYYDPTTDFYVEREEMDLLNKELAKFVTVLYEKYNPDKTTTYQHQCATTENGLGIDTR